jgi:hypothetical protein
MKANGLCCVSACLMYRNGMPFIRTNWGEHTRRYSPDFKIWLPRPCVFMEVRNTQEMTHAVLSISISQ